jgi:lysozyme
MANENMTMSDAGMTALRRHEGAVLRYYNDQAQNCTYGVGTLAHIGPCTPEELQRPVTMAQVDLSLAGGVRSAESVVRRGVPDQQLTQDQFDALVSYVYNVGAGGARRALEAANRNAPTEVAHHMNQTVFIHPHDAHGHRLPPAVLPGLVRRRQHEARPFENAAQTTR